MATILNFEAYQERMLPGHWVEQGAVGRLPKLRGWGRDLGAVAEVLFSTKEGPPAPERVRWICARTRDYTETVGGKAALAFRASLFATTWIAPVLVVKAPPLRRLSFDDRLRALKRYERSPLGLTLFAVKAFSSISWFEHPESAREANFDGGCAAGGA